MSEAVDVIKFVKGAVDGSAPDVKTKLCEKLVQREVDSRVDKLDAGIKKFQELTRDLGKIKPDNVTYNEDGSEASKTYSKSKLDEKKKASERLNKLEKALENAITLSSPDAYQKLEEVLKK